eukprot:scaffold8374_cov175-Amphora_coffeaeformis.AAC.7
MYNDNQTQALLDGLLGTWTVWTDLHTGSYRVKAYFVVHFDVDPMRHYGCRLEDCSAIEGRICRMEPYHGEKYQAVCHSMMDATSSWSDVTMFLKIGFAFHAGAPFWISRQVTTGDDWMGPYNLVWAAATHDTDNTFVSRYVKTLLTQYLRQRPPHETLYAQDEFLATLGPDAVRNTLAQQVNWNWNRTTNQDPYQRFHSTCTAGNVTPALPQFRIQPLAVPDDTSLDIQVDYALLLAPGARAYNVMPWIARQVNKQYLGFTIKGPYCWGSDPKRAYVQVMGGWVDCLMWSSIFVLACLLTCCAKFFSLYIYRWLIDVSLRETISLNSTSPPIQAASSSNLHLTRGCVEGLPCFPTRGRNAADTTTTVIQNTTGWSVTWVLFVFVMGVILGRCGCRCGRCRRLPVVQSEERDGLEEPLLQQNYAGDDGAEQYSSSSVVAQDQDSNESDDNVTQTQVPPLPIETSVEEEV